MKLIHYGCSFAMGNGIPYFIKGLPAEVAPKLHWKTAVKRQQMLKTYGNLLKDVEDPMSCGLHIANQLNLRFSRIADNGISNEMIFRRLLSTVDHDCFVLIGLTGYNRREGLTTAENKTHWHTWKQVDPADPVGYKDLPFDPWVNKKGQREYKPAIEEEGQIRTAIQIIYMQSFLKSMKVPHLIFNALYNGFDNPLTNECKKLISKIDKKYYFDLQANFDNCQHGWCLKKGLTVSEIDQHPNVQGQKEWGNLMLSQCKSIMEEYANKKS